MKKFRSASKEDAINFDIHQQILKSKKKIKTDNQLKNMLKKISTKYLSIANKNLEQGTIKHINHIHATNNNMLINGKEEKNRRHN